MVKNVRTHLRRQRFSYLPEVVKVVELRRAQQREMVAAVVDGGGEDDL